MKNQDFPNGRGGKSRWGLANLRHSPYGESGLARPHPAERMVQHGKQEDLRRVYLPPPEGAGAHPAGIRRQALRHRVGGQQVGEGSFPKLKIPHQSHADFCSTDTAGGLDNKKRRYAPRGGVAYRLFLWGFPKGATPPFGTRLCEAKCSVLYALPALP